MKSGWLTPVTQEETRGGTAVCWASKRPTGGWRNNLCAEMGGASWWGRSKGPACAPERTTYGKEDLLMARLKRLHSSFQKNLPCERCMFVRQRALTTAECCTAPKLSVSTATTATTATKTPRSAWGKPGPPTKPWNSVWTERRTSFSQPGKHGHSHLPLLPPHAPNSLQKLTRVCLAGTARCRATGARGGSRLSSQSKQWSGPAALNPAQVILPVPRFPSHTLTHRSVDVLSYSIFSPSRFVLMGLTFVFCSPHPLPAWEAGVDPGVCRSCSHRPGGCRFSHFRRQEDGLQPQVSWKHMQGSCRTPCA